MHQPHQANAYLPPASPGSLPAGAGADGQLYPRNAELEAINLQIRRKALGAPHQAGAQVLELTGGKGVDVIVEMLANANLAHDLSVLARVPLGQSNS